MSSRLPAAPRPPTPLGVLERAARFPITTVSLSALTDSLSLRLFVLQTLSLRLAHLDHGVPRRPQIFFFSLATTRIKAGILGSTGWARRLQLERTHLFA